MIWDAIDTSGENERLNQGFSTSMSNETAESMLIGLAPWLKAVMGAWQAYSKFRIEIIYDAEASRTTFAIYTPVKEDGSDDTKPGCSADEYQVFYSGKIHKPTES